MTIYNIDPSPQSCFSVPPPACDLQRVQVEVLGSAGADALATLLPVLQCGEESASLVFDALALTACPPDQLALRCIAEEERLHEQLLHGLAASLPSPAQQAPIRSAARRFYVRQQHRSVAVHFVRIAALDSGACVILAALLRRTAVVARAREVQGIFKRIYADEARHVRLSRRHAIGRLAPSIVDDVAHETRRQLADVLGTVAACFEALGVDADQLDRHLRQVPQGLYA